MLADQINFIRKLSFRKLWNIFQVQLSYILASILKIPLVWGKPWFVSIEPASVCNLSCPQCPVGEGDISRKNKFIDLAIFKDLLEEISGTTTMLSLYFQGEPLMHKEFSQFVRMASEAGIYTQTSTNAQLLSEELSRGIVEAGLDRIIISMDGMDQESYQAYRKGGDLVKVETAVRNLRRIREKSGSNTPCIIVQFLVFKHNQEQVQGIRKMAGQLGADRVWIKTAQVEYSESADEWVPEGKKYTRYNKNANGEWQLRGKLKNRCRRLWQTTVVTSDGLVVPCCFDKKAAYPMGSVSGTSLKEIWNGKSYQDFRKQVLSNRKKTGICTNCTEGIGKF